MLFHKPSDSIKSRYVLGTKRLARKEKVDPVPVSVVSGRLEEIVWKVLEDQE